MGDDSYWNDALPRLVHLFDGCSFQSETQDVGLLIGHSVTEWEAKSAISKEADASRLFWLHRQFSGGVSTTDPATKYWEYDDVSKLDKQWDFLAKKAYLDELRSWMTGRMPVDRTADYNSCSFESYVSKDAAWSSQLQRWTEDTRHLLKSSLNDVMALRQRWHLDGCDLGLSFNY